MARALRYLTFAGTLVAVLAFAPIAAAQTGTFDSLIAQASTLTQQYVTQIESAQAGTDLATIQARARVASATGAQLVSTLQAAKAAATDDAGRSRAQGLLDHVNSAQSSLQSAITASDISVARGALDAAHGEAVEARSELPTTLPVTGDPLQEALPVLAVAGLALMGVGSKLRRATVS
jgi:hypothetical protein